MVVNIRVNIGCMWFVSDCILFFFEKLNVNILSNGNLILVIKNLVLVD